eukprot:COSAG05_NODE_5075_length_1271_cov_1.401024_1_plen_47_part_00
MLTMLRLPSPLLLALLAPCHGLQNGFRLPQVRWQLNTGTVQLLLAC